MIKEYLKALTSLNGLPTQEEDIIDYMFDHFCNDNKDVRVDKVGNVISFFKSNKKDAKKLVVFAHMDEIGFVIRKIEKNGYLRFERIGGVNTQILPGTHVNVLGNEQMPGVIGVQSHHFMNADNKFKIPPTSDLYIDIGVDSLSEANALGIHVGNMVVFRHEWMELQNSVVAAKAMDDRIGCSILLDLSKKIRNQDTNFDVYLVACVMEEFNIRGILPAIRKIRPDISIGIDITPACDTPDLSYNEIGLGNGLALTYMNFHGRGTLAGVLPDMKLVKELEKLCNDNKIKFQREVSPGVITENAFILFENEGVSVANVSVPTRYTHTPFECINMKDVIDVSNLLHIFITYPSVSTEFGKERRNTY